MHSAKVPSVVDVPGPPTRTALPGPSLPQRPVLKTLEPIRKQRFRVPSRNRNAVQFSGQALASGLESLKNARAVSSGFNVDPSAQVSFIDPDSPANIWLAEDGTIRAATFSKLVEKLTGSTLGVGVYCFL